MLLQETVTALDNLLNTTNQENWQQLMMVCTYEYSEFNLLNNNDFITYLAWVDSSKSVLYFPYRSKCAVLQMQYSG